MPQTFDFFARRQRILRPIFASPGIHAGDRGQITNVFSPLQRAYRFGGFSHDRIAERGRKMQWLKPPFGKPRGTGLKARTIGSGVPGLKAWAKQKANSAAARRQRCAVPRAAYDLLPGAERHGVRCLQT